MTVKYKFQDLEIYKLALGYLDRTYEAVRSLPDIEKFNLQAQIVRAATSIGLNIAEGSTGQSNAEQNRFLGLALRSYLETVACLDVIERRNYLPGITITELREQGHRLFVRLQAFRKALHSSNLDSRSPVPGPRS